MDPDVAFHLEIAAVVAVALIIVAIASRGVCEGAEDISAGTTGRDVGITLRVTNVALPYTVQLEAHEGT
jgi:hypothetical protein